MEWSFTEAEQSYARIVGMDPKADWLLGPGLGDLLPDGTGEYVPFLVVINDLAARALARKLIEEWPIYVYGDYVGVIGSTMHFTAFAPKSFFDALKEVDGPYEFFRTAAKSIRLCLPIREQAMPRWKPRQEVKRLSLPALGPPADGWPPGTVVIGIVDDGIGFAHDRFRAASTTTRIQCFWHQDGHYDHMDSNVAFGREILKDEIDKRLADCTYGGLADEDRIYRQAGLVDFADRGHKALAWRAAHGTHVLDLAAGEDPCENLKTRPIICVQLPTATTADTSGSDLTDKVLHAVDYIKGRAKLLSGDGPLLPIVINFSYGTIAGPHDGTSPLEIALDDIIGREPSPGTQQPANEPLDRPRPRIGVVLPAGNAHLSRCHARIVFQRCDKQCDETIDLPWRALPDDRTPSFLEIWLPQTGEQPPTDSRIFLSIVPPGARQGSKCLGEVHGRGIELRHRGKVVCQARYIFDDSPTRRGHFLICLQPTTRLDPQALPEECRGIAPSGAWTIRLHNASLTPEQPVQAWIQRDDSLYGYPQRGRQSYFDHEDYRRYTAQGWTIEDDDWSEQGPSVVQRAGSMSPIATGSRTLVAGGFVRKKRHSYREAGAAWYSAGGPTDANPHRQSDQDQSHVTVERRKPDALLPTDDSRVHAGILAAGSRSGSVVAIDGTSVAAPQLAWLIAGRPAAKSGSDRDAVKEDAQADECETRFPQPPLPLLRGGWGRLRRARRRPIARLWDPSTESPADHAVDNGSGQG